MFLFLSLLIMVIKISFLEQDENSCKTKSAIYAGIVGCMILPFGMIGIRVNRIFFQDSDHDPSYLQLLHLNFVVPMLCLMEFTVGIVIPTLYFSSKPNLVTFSKNIWKTHFMEPLQNLWNFDAISYCCPCWSNRIVDLDGKV